MTIWKTVQKNIRSEIVLNLITILQMVAAMVVTGILASSVLLRYQYYAPLKECFQTKGIYGIFPDFAMEDPSNPDMFHFLNAEELLEQLDGATDIMAVSMAMTANLADDPLKTFNQYGYTDNLIEAYQPELSEGRWLQSSSEAKFLEVVVSENSYGWHVGDHLRILFYNEPESVIYEAEIVGILQKDTKIPLGIMNDSNHPNFMQFYTTYSFDVEEIPVVLMASEYLAQLDDGPEVVQGVYGSYLMTYPENYTAQQITQEQQKLSQFGSVFSMSFDEMRPNNMQSLFEPAYYLMPIILVLTILTAVGCISSSALTTRRRLRNYAIYYVNGLQWKQCIFINLIQSFVCGVIAIVLAFGCLVLAGYTPLAEYVHIVWGGQLFLWIIVVFILYLIVSIVMPILIIGHNTPKQILTR